ncbi:MAG: sulfite exporter TauE/SafE family protein [Candidatus Bathyarchaeia archaeon]
MIAVGFVIGVLSGFFGFGGGFILTPLLISLGFPANISVGTSIMEIFISSLVASIRHRSLGNVDAKVGLVVASTSILGAESGAQVIERLKMIGVQYMNSTVSLIYILVLSLTSTCIIRENLFLKMRDYRRNMPLLYKFNELKIPPLIAIPRSKREKISVWVIILIGFISGLSAGFLGAGGGFILIPLLIYVIGYKPPIAAGTCVFCVLLNSIYASLTHAIKGNINLILATLIFVGSLIGMQIGIAALKYVKEVNFKLLLGLCLSFVSLGMLVGFLSEPLGLSSLSLLSPIITFISVLTVALFISVDLLKERRKNKKTIKDH